MRKEKKKPFVAVAYDKFKLIEMYIGNTVYGFLWFLLIKKSYIHEKSAIDYNP